MARILIVDDDISIRILLRKLLEDDGHQIEEAVDGKQAVRCYWENPADLVITDVLMPEKDGVELIRDLLRGFPDVRVVAMSGGGRWVSARRGLQLAGESGAAHLLEKPFTKKQILEIVHRFV
ncbi:MAG: response regulator [Magnetococcales bacterium]|nr:response regulator [Magnetococcales bacterium]